MHATTTQALKDFYAPAVISEHDRARAYYHCFGDEDKADIIRRVAPERAAELTKATNFLSRCTDINGEVWATFDKKPYRKNAPYIRIK